MTFESQRSPFAVALWLLAGVIVGGLVTGAIVVGAADLIGGESPKEASGVPRFVEESETSGVTHVYDGEFLFFVGGGVAVFDCNEDLYPDLYLAGGVRSAGLYVNQSETGGELRFNRLRHETTDVEEVTGAYPIDIDSDGLTDLAVLRVGENMMLRGLGNCEFEMANNLWNIPGGDDWTAAFSAKWEDGESLPTMAFGNYLSLDALEGRDECAIHDLFRPRGQTYGSPTALSPGWCTLSILFSDWSRTGDRDLRMTNDRHYYREGQEQLWRVDPGEEPAPYTEGEGWRSMRIWGMGIASHDLTGDGRPEVFLTSQGDNKLQTLTSEAEGPTYEDIALAAGATAHRPFIGDSNRPSTAWHAEFGDVNNDTFVDLFVTKGNVDSQVEFAMDDPNNLLLGQPDGSFEEAARDAGILDYSLSRGGAVTDLNLDGLLDLVVVERREPMRIWRNTGTEEPGNWVAIDPVQEAPNLDAIGSWVEVSVGSTTLRGEVTIGGGHAGGELGPVHFGVGDAETVEVRVIWPDGTVSAWHTVEANRIVTVDRASGTVKPASVPGQPHSGD